MSGLNKFIASGFGSGYSPFAPGTAGSLVAFLFIAFCFWFKLPSYNSIINLNEILIILTLVFLILGVHASNKLEAEWGHDCQKIVVDEMVGYWVTLWFLPINWTTLIVALVLFRLFDIFKPWPIRLAEKWPKGYGVMGDDVVAGLFANIVLQIINIFL